MVEIAGQLSRLPNAHAPSIMQLFSPDTDRHTHTNKHSEHQYKGGKRRNFVADVILMALHSGIFHLALMAENGWNWMARDGK